MTDAIDKYDRALHYVHRSSTITTGEKCDHKKYVKSMSSYQGTYMKYLIVVENEVKICDSQQTCIYDILKSINLECLDYLVHKLCTSRESIIENNRKLFLAKNADYGNSFEDFGFLGIMVRLNDKINRMKSLAVKNANEVSSESFMDTVQDLYNYTLLGLMYV